MTDTIMVYRTRHSAANGDVCEHDYTRWLDAKACIESIRELYEAIGFECADDEDTWITGLERKHVFTKAGRPDRVIEYMRAEVTATF